MKQYLLLVLDISMYILATFHPFNLMVQLLLALRKPNICGWLAIDALRFPDQTAVEQFQVMIFLLVVNCTKH